MAAALANFWYSTGSIEGSHWIKVSLDALGERKPERITIKLLISYLGDERVTREMVEFDQALKLSEELGDTGLHAEMLLRLGFTLDRRGRLAEAEEIYTKAVPLLRQTGKKKQLAKCYSWWAITHFVRGNAEAARKGFDQALELSRSLADEQLSAVVLGNVGELAFAEGDIAKAIQFGIETTALRSKIKDLVGQTNSMINLAAYLLAAGNLQEARDLAQDAIQRGREAQTEILVAYGLQHLAVIAARQNKAPQGARMLGYVDEVIRKMQYVREPTERWSYEQLMTALHESLTEDQIQALASEGARWSEDQAIEEARKI